MNVAIIGRTEILYDTAKLLDKKGHNIKLIVTSKETPEYKRTSEDFRCLADKLCAEYLSTSQISSKDSIEFIKKMGQMDIGISINYINIIPQKVINLFPYGILNAHGGDLPRYRGNACQAWAIINGEKKVGLCIHKMVGGELDSGDIIAREYKEINIDTKVGELWEWMSKRTPELFLEAISKLEKDKDYFLAKQSTDPKDVLRCYPRMPDDGRIDWSKSNIEILRLINASSEPYQGAFCEYEGKKLIVWDAELYDDAENYCAVAGQIARINKSEEFIIVTTGSGKLKVKEIEYEGYRVKPTSVIKSIRNRLK